MRMSLYCTHVHCTCNSIVQSLGFIYNCEELCSCSCAIIHLPDQDNMSGGRSSLYPPRGQTNSQKAMSLPSSPHELSSPTPDRIGTHKVNEEMVSAWNRVLGLPMFQNKPLLPFEEWNIDFSELTVGTRVGIGKHCQ